MGACPREALMSVRTLHAETSHALRVAGCEGNLCCLEYEHLTDESVDHTDTDHRQKWTLPTQQRREENESY